MAADDQEIAVTINGTLHRGNVPADLSLLDWLQEDLGLTGTKFCCAIGVCRACTVAVQPGNADLHSNLGSVLGGMGQFDEAAAAIRQSLALRPGRRGTG